VPNPQMPRSKVKENPWDWIIELYDTFKVNHQPLEDVDGDKYSGI
jgi:hypothetical protein